MRAGGWIALAAVALLGAIQVLSLDAPVDRAEERAAHRATLSGSVETVGARR